MNYLHNFCYRSDTIPVTTIDEGMSIGASGSTRISFFLNNRTECSLWNSILASRLYDRVGTHVRAM